MKWVVIVETALLTILLCVGVLYERNPNVTTAQCTVTSASYRPGIGNTVIIKYNGSSLMVQEEKCLNMENIEVGQTFKGVIVSDDNDVLQCVVKVSE